MPSSARSSRPPPTVECEVIGLEDSFDGLLDRTRTRRAHAADVTGILRFGGTILGTTNRGNPVPLRWTTTDGPGRRLGQGGGFEEMGLDALVVIGGDGTLEIAHQFSRAASARRSAEDDRQRHRRDDQ